MKTLTLIIAVVIGLNCWGQKKDSVPSFISSTSLSELSDSARMLLLSTWATNMNTGRSEFTITPKRDTIPVIMLVCDTTWDTNEYVEIYDSSTHKIIDKYWIFHASGNIWWQFGYEVREWNSTAIGILYHEPLYFDQNKKPLSKNLVVWMTKEIK